MKWKEFCIKLEYRLHYTHNGIEPIGKFEYSTAERCYSAFKSQIYRSSNSASICKHSFCYSLQIHAVFIYLTTLYVIFFINLWNSSVIAFTICFRIQNNSDLFQLKISKWINSKTYSKQVYWFTICFTIWDSSLTHPQQCLNQAGEPMATFKQQIEQNFENVKTITESKNPVLTPFYKDW